jgi:hypothetical protein
MEPTVTITYSHTGKGSHALWTPTARVEWPDRTIDGVHYLAIRLWAECDYAGRWRIGTVFTNDGSLSGAARAVIRDEAFAAVSAAFNACDYRRLIREAHAREREYMEANHHRDWSRLNEMLADKTVDPVKP